MYNLSFEFLSHHFSLLEDKLDIIPKAWRAPLSCLKALGFQTNVFLFLLSEKLSLQVCPLLL